MATAPALVVLAAGLARRYGGCKPLAPVGPAGEAVIDLVVSDAVEAGFGDVVLVLHPETGPAIRYHVEQCWPRSVAVAFAEQAVPRGTVDAVLAAGAALGDRRPFAVANADDVYGQGAMALVARHLDQDHDEHALIGYHLRSTVVSDAPVTRAACAVDASGHLTGLTERRQVARHGDGEAFTALDGTLPDKLDGDVLVSVNLWGFQPAIWPVLHAALASGAQAGGGSTVPTGSAGAATRARGGDPGDRGPEVLLPEVVGDMVATRTGRRVRVLPTADRCLGVTHADDLPLVAAALDRQVATGARPARLWEGLR